MFLYNENQIYMDTKFSKRPQIIRQDTKKRSSERKDLTKVIRGASANQLSQNHTLMNARLSESDRFMHTRLYINNQQNFYLASISERMQRTKKYHSRDGHKFLFNNT